MAWNTIRSRAALIDYVYEQLGLQFHRVLITEEQLNFIIDDSLQIFFEATGYGFEERYIAMPVTIDKVDYELPFEVQSVTHVIYTDNLMDYFSIERTITDMTVFNSFRYTNLTLLDIEMVRQYTQTVKNMLIKDISFDFNPITKRIHFHVAPKSNANYILHVYRIVDESDLQLDFNNFYNNIWLKRYVIALAKIKIADNISIYSETPLPDGVKINPEYYRTTGESDRDKLDIELREMYQVPLGFLVG